MKNHEKVRIGRKGEVNFESGYYAYVGSALSGLKNRLKRHLNSSKKKRWHIDYLLEKAKIEGFFVWLSRNNIEDKIACKLIRKFEYVNGFGSSDSKCRSHLFYSDNKQKLVKALFRVLRRQSLFIEF